MHKFAKIFEALKNNIMCKFGNDPGRMLVYTGVLGWFLSSAAQVFAIAINKEIPKEQKAFLIPQEIGDGAINVLSFFIITSGIKSLASKLVSTGKLASNPVREFLSKSIKEGKLNSKQIGNIGFDISKMPNFGEIKEPYYKFKKGTDVVAATIGSIISCNLVTPIVRNNIAAKRQVKSIARMHNNQTYTYPRTNLDSFLMQSHLHSGGLRV